ncbi:MAG: ABC transporter permease [Bacillota bacterium]|jgi:ABC-2 type transport system permease protein
MSTAVKYLSLLLANMRLNIASAMEYRFSFWSQVLFMILNNVFLLFFWWVFFTNFQAVQGWEFSHILLLYALLSGAYGLACIVAGNSLNLGEVIAKGELDFYLLLPVDPLFNLLTARMKIHAIGDLAFALVLAPLALGWDLQGLALFLVMLSCGALVLTGFWTMVGCLSFFWGYNQGFAGLAQEAVIMFATYPDYIFTGIVRSLLFTIIPAGFVTYLPVSLIRDFSWPKLAVMLAVATGFTLAARSLFALGVRRYESGNLLVTRL